MGHPDQSKRAARIVFLFLKEEVLSCKMSHASSSKALQRVSYGGVHFDPLRTLAIFMFDK